MNSDLHAFDLTGRTALVAVVVLGGAIALVLTQYGAQLTVLGRTKAALERVMTSLQAGDAHATWVVADVTDAGLLQMRLNKWVTSTSW